MQLVIQNGDEIIIVLKYILLVSLGSYCINGNVSRKIKQFIVIKVILIILLIYE